MAYQVLLDEQPREFLDAADEKTYRIVRENLLKLEDAPYPGQGKGDKRHEVVDGEEVFRLRIGRTWTAFYDVFEDDGVVKVYEVLSINEAHKRYGH